MSGITLSALEEEVLTLLSSKQAYGLQILDAIAEASNRERDGSSGTFYPIFKKLEQKKLIVSEWGDSLIGARRKYYQITQTGIHALQEKAEYRARLAAWKN